MGRLPSQPLAADAPEAPIGEAWAVFEGNRIQNGPYAGQTLGDLAARFPAQILGTHATGTRFPLLIKLLDCADWLSVQVHPNDEQAAELEGAGELGKTEAWHILEADEGAELIAGIREGTSPEKLKEAILRGEVMDYAERWPVQAGDTVMMPAGTLHALGPGLLLYEVRADQRYHLPRLRLGSPGQRGPRPASGEKCGSDHHQPRPPRGLTARRGEPEATPDDLPLLRTGAAEWPSDGGRHAWSELSRHHSHGRRDDIAGRVRGGRLGRTGVSGSSGGGGCV